MEKILARREFVRVLTAAGLSATLAGQLAQKALAQSKGVSDVDILQLALTAEYLAADAYTKSQFGGFEGLVKDYLQAALEQEEAHVKALRDTLNALGAKPVERPNFVYPVEFLPRNQLAILRLLNALEDAFVGAYLGALPLIQNKDILKAAGAILGNEAAHRATVRASRILLGDQELPGPRSPADRAFEVAITPEEATKAVSGFIRK
ncbi:ferritin-like domain-containing protein [Thermus filiformis]|uniref:Ferritin-like domain-containing protein n=1 Tax=Thermus filiformis TaxID=276 RepID=A0A0A2WSG0_THEFI|nr:ferritin-like domain-containing protein [Thermus filiformis]KGQ21225.1 hypothetical protein THFILI_02030 [Thermus filiformis]